MPFDTLPFIGNDAGLRRQVAVAAHAATGSAVEVEVLPGGQSAVDYLRVEMPELVFIDLADTSVDADAVLDTIAGDPWLLHGGIVALGEGKAARRLEERRGLNLVAVLGPDGRDTQLQRVLEMVHHNRRILFQREIEADLVGEIEGYYRLRNDPLEARCFSNLVCNFLYNANHIDADTRDGLNVALYEMLMNAIEHGNCGISFEEKTDWLEGGRAVTELIDQRCADPEIAVRRVTFEYAIHPGHSEFLISDEGTGFDWRGAEERAEDLDLFAQHGRGIMMTRALTRNLSYNEVGNEVRFEIEHRADEASLTPELLAHIEPVDFEPGATVFAEGEPGTFLYYIAKGRYEVVVGERVVSTLSPDDIFMGEMAFLLNNRRSAGVRAQTPGRLIKISKKDFVEAVQNKPHYALLLARLLAQRIERANRR
jgi:hypothetical protein